MPILEDGQLFERYRVHRWLGSGIAGESYEAEDRILQRKVTLKLIHPWTTLPDSARRQFFREMQGISLLNHPHLATVLDYGETDGRIYVARRYVSSGSLLGTNGRTWFHPPLPLADAFKYAHQLAQALQYIHQHGYLHGALTFANVLVLRGPNTENDANYAPFLLADVGLANFVRRFGHPRIETLPVSAAPEQLNKRVTPASDQFALAVLLYFWLAGRPPYLGTSSEVEHQKLSEKITPLSILNPGVTLEQDELILRALTIYPEDRHASVLTFAEALLASLASANRHYALPTSSPAPQTETPLTNQQEVQNIAPIQTTEAETQAEATNHAHATTTATPAEQPTPPAQIKAEPYRSALEQLLAVPYETDQASFAEEARSLPIEEIEEDEGVDEEENTLLPTLPETPRLEETTIQTEFALIVSEEQAEPQASKQTGPLVSEPALDILYSEVNDFMVEMPLDLPDSTDSPALDEFPPALDEISSSSQPDEPLSTMAEVDHIVSQEELVAPNGKSAAFPGPAEPAASDDVVAPTLLPDAPAFPLTLPDEFLSSSEDATPTPVSNEPLPITVETISTDLPETPLLA
ncbi:MAG TPA: serine/threonine-protein kinase, partial [Ktedonobacteraceae bacterium]|nr:serine/threonine-protein kinase [Ktedonobacteraceae bacterium]